MGLARPSSPEVREAPRSNVEKYRIVMDAATRDALQVRLMRGDISANDYSKEVSMHAERRED